MRHAVSRNRRNSAQSRGSSPRNTPTPSAAPRYYLSPELLNNQPYGRASDVWALGCILHEMATLEHPFEATSFPSLAFKILNEDPTLDVRRVTYKLPEQLGYITGDLADQTAVHRVFAEVKQSPKFIGSIGKSGRIPWPMPLWSFLCAFFLFSGGSLSTSSID